MTKNVIRKTAHRRRTIKKTNPTIICGLQRGMHTKVSPLCAMILLSLDTHNARNNKKYCPASPLGDYTEALSQNVNRSSYPNQASRRSRHRQNASPVWCVLTRQVSMVVRQKSTNPSPLPLPTPFALLAHKTTSTFRLFHTQPIVLRLQSARPPHGAYDKNVNREHKNPATSHGATIAKKIQEFSGLNRRLVM